MSWDAEESNYLFSLSVSLSLSLQTYLSRSLGSHPTVKDEGKNNNATMCAHNVSTTAPATGDGGGSSRRAAVREAIRDRYRAWREPAVYLLQMLFSIGASVLCARGVNYVAWPEEAVALDATGWLSRRRMG